MLRSFRQGVAILLQGQIPVLVIFLGQLERLVQLIRLAGQLKTEHAQLVFPKVVPQVVAEAAGLLNRKGITLVSILTSWICCCRELRLASMVVIFSLADFEPEKERES